MRLAPDMIQRVKDIASNALYDYEAVGARVQDVPFALGPMAHRSHVWYNGDDTREAVHNELAPCSDIEFLERYLELAPDDLIVG